MAVHPSPRSPWYASIVTRSTFVFALLLLAAISLTGWFSWKASRDGLVAEARLSMAHTLDIAAAHVEAFDHTLREDIDLLATNDAVERWCALADTSDTTGRALAIERIAAFMDPFIHSRALYAQVRAIAADSLGMEVVRYDRGTGGIARVPDSLLQAKGDRDYYLATLSLSKGQRRFSPIDLNKEHGVIQRPWMPTLRASAPLFSPRGARAGMVVINADLRPFFSGLISLADTASVLMLADAHGELLLHPDTSLTFRSEIGGSSTLVGRIPDLGRTIPGDSLLFAVHGITLGPDSARYTLAISRPMSGVLSGLRHERDRLIELLALIWGGSVLLAMLFAMGTRARLKRMTDRVERYAIGEAVDLPKGRRDEIGQMARGLHTMRQRIDARVKELEEARAAAEKSDRERRELLANMSHEVRTPLNAILGMSSDIDSGALDPTDQEKLAVVRRSAERLRGLVDDLLTDARITEGKLAVHIAPVDLRALIMDIALAHRPAASAKGVALRTDLSGIPDSVPTDALRIHQVIDNLVGNAVRFTREGHVDVRGSLEPGNRLSVTVADTGPGIDPSEHLRVFQRFERAASSEAHDQGAGLGLAITDRIVKLLGGRLVLESTPGAGSRFTVLLPIPANTDPAPAVPAPRATLRAPDTSGLRVLYVEDVSTNRMLLSQWAEKSGWRLELAESGKEALHRCDQELFDVLLIDLGLGEGMRGTELALRLRGTKRHRFAPMIAVTAYAAEEEDAEVLTVGMNDRVTKPIDKDQLLRTVAFWCDRTGPAAEEPSIPALAAQYDDDPEKMLKVLQQYRREFTQRRLALRNALAAADAKALSDVRHALRPHWQLLGLRMGVAALDALGITASTEQRAVIEEVFRACDRALMRAQRGSIKAA